MRRRTATATLVTLAAATTVMASAGTAGAAGAASAMPPTGDQEFKSGSGELTVHWFGRCHVNIQPNEFTGTWHPSLNLKVVEEGQTAWKWVKLAYKYRTSDETFIVRTEIGDIGPRNAVFDPPRYNYADAPAQVGSTDQIDRSGDAFGVGFRLAVSNDGNTWTVLTQPGLLDCTPPSQ
jgi:hypothetical protein